MGVDFLSRRLKLRAFGVPASVAAFLFIVALTLLPQSGPRYAATVFCLTCDELWGVDAFLNLLLFVPLGAALYLVGFSPSLIAVTSFGLSSVIELLQWGVIPGRDPSLRDVIANGTGGAIGGLLVAAISILVCEGKPVHVRLALAVVLAFWCAQALVTGWAVAPEAPTAHAYYGQWAHVFPETVPFRGKVTDAKLNHVFVRDDSLAETGLLRQGMDDAGVLLEVKVDSLPPSAGEAQVFGLVAGPTMILGIDLWPKNLRFESRSRAAYLGLMPPSILLPNPVARTDLTIRAVHTRSDIALDLLADGHVVESARWKLSAARGFSLLLPRRIRASQLPLWSMCWIALFSIAAGLLTGGVAESHSEGRRYLLLVIVVMIAPLLIASGLFRCALPSPADVLGLVGGCLVGLWCGRGVCGRRRGHAY